MKTSTNLSLNDVLLHGPVIQPDLFDILLRFRLYVIVITADVAKMYRQVLVNQDDQDYQRILWLDSPDKPVGHFKLNTVTYGTASFLATRVLKELAILHAAQYPEASKSIMEDFYMDDYISGANDIETAEVLYQNVSEVLKSGGMHLRKWCSNNEKMRSTFSNTSKEIYYSLNLGPEETTTSLGLNWCPTTDKLLFLNKAINSKRTNTKRELLSTLNSVFNPLGFLGPVLIRGKVFLQELWQLQLGWDDELPAHTQDRWKEFLKDLDHLDRLKISRATRTSYPGKIELHGFCDASQIAFGACVYLRQLTDVNTWKVQLLCAKSRVAPTKTLTIPRLELSGAVLLSELMQRVSKVTNITFDNMVCWCDSTVELSWIRGVPAQWKTFVANRVSQIIDAVGARCWRHIDTSQNPADPLSRGITTDGLINSDIWWSGPRFLSSEQSTWPFFGEKSHSSEQIVFEQRPIKYTLAINTRKNSLLHAFSNWNKLLRITAVWLRFIKWLRHRHCLDVSSVSTGPMRVMEIEQAQDVWVRYAQNESFNVEMQILSKGGVITKGPLKGLSPYMDVNILRVGGRLGLSNESFAQKHPALLPRNHRVTELICIAYHLRFLHYRPTRTASQYKNEVLAITRSRCSSSDCQSMPKMFSC